MSKKPKKQSVYNFTVSDPQKAVALINQFLAENKFQLRTAKNGQQYFYFNDPVQGLVEYSKRGFEYYVNGNNVQIVAYLGTFENPTPLDDSVVMVLPKNAYKQVLQPLFNSIAAIDDQSYANPQPVQESQYQPQGAAQNQMQGQEILPQQPQPMQAQQAAGYQSAQQSAPMQAQQSAGFQSAQQSVPMQAQQTQQYQQPGNYQMPPQNAPDSNNANTMNQFGQSVNKTNNNMAIFGMVIGIFAIIASLAGTMYGFVSVIGIVLCIKGRSGEKRTLATVGLVLNILAIVIFAIGAAINGME